MGTQGSRITVPLSMRNRQNQKQRKRGSSQQRIFLKQKQTVPNTPIQRLPNMERRVNESREGTQDHPHEEITDVRDHYVSGDKSLFFLCKSKNDRIGKYMSLRTAYETNPELLLSYIHRKKLQEHQECIAYGLDF